VIRSLLLLTCVLLTLPVAVAAQATTAILTECTSETRADFDGDGLGDACETALATTFAPQLVVRAEGCNWDSTYNRLGGGYFYAVQPVGKVVRIAYAPAYFYDCGWTGAKCLLPLIDCSQHAGDSELIVLELRRASTNEWSVAAIFLSAHCFGRSTGDCRWYLGSDLNHFRWLGTHPTIWVAEGRNANYRSWSECDRGHHTIDTCDHNDTVYPVPVLPNRNLGSRTVPRANHGCVAGSELSSDLVEMDSVECFWRRDAPFRGWQVSVSGVTGYERYLREIADF